MHDTLFLFICAIYVCKQTRSVGSVLLTRARCGAARNSSFFSLCTLQNAAAPRRRVVARSWVQLFVCGTLPWTIASMPHGLQHAFVPFLSACPAALVMSPRADFASMQSCHGRLQWQGGAYVVARGCRSSCGWAWGWVRPSCLRLDAVGDVTEHARAPGEANSTMATRQRALKALMRDFTDLVVSI